ncbi:MAG: OPT/YSL family transporter [Verrucomicrobiota bacterium]
MSIEPPTRAPATGQEAAFSKLRRFLPTMGSPAYHVLLSAVAILILGPLGGISAAFMTFSIGIFLGGQVLAGILGSAVTLPYGPEGKHGANYMQTMAASVAGMCAMSALVQAMVWLGLPQPPVWRLILYFLCIGMFGVGVGMLYTPILVDRLRLTYPSGLAVANILRALTDPQLLRRSIFRLGGSVATSYALALASARISALAALDFSTSTFGGGLIVGARIAIPAMVVALIGRWQTPHLVSLGWLSPNDPYRKIGFIISLGAILGAAILDLAIILVQTVRRLRQPSREPPRPVEDWKRVNLVRLVVWVLFWAAAILWVGNRLLHQPLFYLVAAVGLCFLFVLVNGIALGISDFNPISSAFVMTVFILAALGLHDPGVGLLCASVLAIATSEGGDMQQDRSTGWRLGTNRVVQFRYQVIGIAAGAVLAVALAKLFMTAYPILTQDQFAHPHLPGAQKWQSAYTFKMVGALRGITTAQPHVMKALLLGLGSGLLIELARKLLKSRARYQALSTRSPRGRALAFLLDAVFLPSPYAFAFGGFVEFITVVWWTVGGVSGSLFDALQARRRSQPNLSAQGDLPADMSTTSLVGGGFIAGDALAALSVAVYGLFKAVL